MTKVPNLNYNEVINALRRDGWIVVRQKGHYFRCKANFSPEGFSLPDLKKIAKLR